MTSREDLEEAIGAVLYGVVGTTPSTYDGVTKDEALGLPYPKVQQVAA